MTWTPRQHSAALRHRAWHRVLPLRKPAPSWQLVHGTWVRDYWPNSELASRDNAGQTWLAWVVPRGTGWAGYVCGATCRDTPFEVIAGCDSLQRALEAVDNQLRLQGWAT